MKNTRTPKVTLFHCINSFKEIPSLFDNCQTTIIKMACSSMTKDIQLFKAFEAGADAVLVLVCPEDACRYAEGSKRARKRVEYVKTILDDIGLDGNRLNIFNTKASDSDSVKSIIQETLSAIEKMGPNPIVKKCDNTRISILTTKAIDKKSVKSIIQNTLSATKKTGSTPAA